MIDYLSIYAFNEKEREILSKNENIISGKIKLSSKDIRVYFELKANNGEIGLGLSTLFNTFFIRSYLQVYTQLESYSLKNYECVYYYTIIHNFLILT